MKRLIFRLTYFIMSFIATVVIGGCKKFLDIQAPPTSTNQENVYQNDYTSTAVLTGIYTQEMTNFFSGGITSISLIQELSADNLVLNDLNRQGYLSWWRNEQTADYINTDGFSNYFIKIYPQIYIINSAIEGLNASYSITPSVKQRLLGESYFLRAFYYFYLTNIYGDVPLVLNTDYKDNEKKPRIASLLIYQQIEEDLKKAVALLDNRYVDAKTTGITSERVRPNLSTALALLSRVQLYKKDFINAEETASKIINTVDLYGLTEIDSVFLKNSRETIWSLQPVKQGYNTDEATVFLLNRPPGLYGPKYFYLSPSLISSFENSDKRLTSWVNNFSDGTNHYPYAAKYKSDADNNSVTEYCIVFRLAEQYLIRAEARAELGNILGSQEDLNTIRGRAGLLPTNASTISSIRMAILQERRVEFFTEWGQRWFDLKRLSRLDSAMSAAELIKGNKWTSYKALSPIPNSEIILNKNITQNNGY